MQTEISSRNLENGVSQSIFPTNQIETTFPHLGIVVVVSTLQCGLGDLFGELVVELKILEDEASHRTQKLEESKRTGPPTPQKNPAASLQV